MQISMLGGNYSDDIKTKNKVGFGLRSLVSTSTHIVTSTPVKLGTLLWSLLVLPPLHHFVHAQIPQPFYQNPLVPVLLLPFITNPPSENTGEKMRGRNGGEQNLSEEKGPLSDPPFPPKNAPRDGGR